MMAVYRQGALVLKNIITQTVITSRNEIRNIKRWVSPTLKELKRRKDKLGPQSEIPRSSFLEWNYQAEIFAFGKRLNEEFNKNILQTALINRSYIIQEEAMQQRVGIENLNINIEDNKSLIDEGEKFIQEHVKKQLRSALPKFPTEGIDVICKQLTSNEFLANIAFNIGLKDIILCAEYPPDISTLSNSFKAVVAALYHSSGNERASNFVEEFVVLRQLAGRDINEMWHIENPLEKLNQLLNAKPESRLCNESGVNTILAVYQVGLYLEKQCVGLGWGETIDTAIEMAARDGLKRLFGTTDSMLPIRIKKFTEMSNIRVNIQH